MNPYIVWYHSYLFAVLYKIFVIGHLCVLGVVLAQFISLFVHVYSTV
uniref:Uncharacterized protein n=1 Tax=Arundo donax TaxID=35708 RepID=A0A0A9FRV6_ARUDO